MANGKAKKCPCLSSLAVTPYQNEVVDLVVFVLREDEDVSDPQSQTHHHDGGQSAGESPTAHGPADGGAGDDRRSVDVGRNRHGDGGHGPVGARWQRLFGSSPTEADGHLAVGRERPGAIGSAYMGCSPSAVTWRPRSDDVESGAEPDAHVSLESPS